MEIISISKKTSPLCFLPDGQLVTYGNGCVSTLFEGVKQRSYVIPKRGKEWILGRSRFLYRLLRLGIRASIAIDNDKVLLARGNVIQELDMNTGELSTGWNCGEGIRPLIFTSITGIEGFEDGIYFGGYLGNNYKKPVCIYRRTGLDQWEIVYTFREGTINHVHNVVADPYRNCIWIFTGDFGEAAAIWKVTDGFKRVERVACNDQKYRACVAFALPEGLLYATDAPFAENSIYLLNPVNTDVKELFPIHGSCIYGCRWNNKYVFSSTIEGDGRNNTRWQFYFGRKRGAGIKDDYVHMYMGNLLEGFKEIYKEKKDCMPYYTFQFGVFKFPAGENNGTTLFFQPVATKQHDLCLLGMG